MLAFNIQEVYLYYFIVDETYTFNKIDAIFKHKFLQQENGVRNLINRTSTTLIIWI